MITQILLKDEIKTVYKILMFLLYIFYYDLLIYDFIDFYFIVSIILMFLLFYQSCSKSYMQLAFWQQAKDLSCRNTCS